MPATDTAHLVSSRSLVRSTLWSLAGQIAPGLVAIVVLPILIHGFGTDRFGVLSLSWMIVGYFSLFDLGTGRALTKLVADALGGGQREKLGELIWTALVMMAAMGALAMVVAAILSRWLVFHVLKIPPAIQQESLGAFYLLSVSLPFVITSTGFRGVLEGLHRFDLVNSVRIPQGMLSFIAPLLVLPFTKSLVWMVGAVIAVRVLNWMAFLTMCLRQVPQLRHGFAFKVSHTEPLLKTGGWMTVSNVIGPLILYLDRFFIGSVLSVAAVAYYSTPFDVLIRLTMIPGAMASVLFPAFATTWEQSKGLAVHRLRQGIKFTLIVIFPAIFVFFALAPDLLRVWLGMEFARASSSAARLLSIGVLFNCLAQMPFAFLQAAGKSSFTAKTHFWELVLQLVAVFPLIKLFGIAGAAAAFALRSLADLLILLFATEHVLGEKLGNYWRILPGMLLAFLATAYVSELVHRVALLSVVLVCFSALVLRFFSSVTERKLLREFLALGRTIR